MSQPVSALMPWTDHKGRFCPLRTVGFVGALLPAIWIGYALWADQLLREPFKQATHLTGEWCIYFLLMTLSVTPLRRLLNWPRLAILRRMLGLTAFAYAAGHVTLYVIDQNGNLGHVASEIVSRLYLTIGFIAVTGLSLLAATSFDRAIRRMGRNWKRLHWLVYPLTALGLLHFFLQSKIDVSHPVIATGIFIALLLHRGFAHFPEVVGRIWAILIVAILSAAAAALIEVAWYAGMTGIAAGRVFEANFHVLNDIRPIWWVLAITSAAALVPIAKAGISAFRPNTADVRAGSD